MKYNYNPLKFGSGHDAPTTFRFEVYFAGEEDKPWLSPFGTWDTLAAYIKEWEHGGKAPKVVKVLRKTECDKCKRPFK